MNWNWIVFSTNCGYIRVQAYSRNKAKWKAYEFAAKYLEYNGSFKQFFKQITKVKKA